MKNSCKIIALVIVFLAVIPRTEVTAATSSVNIPANVIKEFNSQYPEARIKKWKIADNNYIVAFKEDGRTATSTYTEDGTWESTVSNVKYVKQLPAAVSEGFNKSKFHNYCVEDIKAIATPSGNRYILKVDNYNCNAGVTEGVGTEDNEELKFNATGLLIKVTDLAGPDEDDI